jgi:predicted DNA-binding transcriptional regulator YafY
MNSIDRSEQWTTLFLKSFGIPAMEDTIIAALDHRRVLSFTYEGQSRTVNPHALFREDQLRKLVLHAWQTDGDSNTRTPPCWGNFHLDKIIGLVVLDESFFGAQPDFNPRHFRRIIHSLS